MQPPVRVKVRGSRYQSTDNATVQGKIVGTAFDEYGNLWAYAVLDENAPVISPYGVSEGSYWPIEGDELVAVTQGWHLTMSGMGVQLQSGLPIFVYAQQVPEDDG